MRSLCWGKGNFFTMRLQNKFLRGAAGVPSLGVPKTKWDGAQSNLVWWEVSLPMAGGWNKMICKVPSNPKQLVILWSFEIYFVGVINIDWVWGMWSCVSAIWSQLTGLIWKSLKWGLRQVQEKQGDSFTSLL